MPVLTDDILIAGGTFDFDDLRVSLHSVIIGVNEDRTEAARETFLLLGRERLIAKEDDAVI